MIPSPWIGTTQLFLQEVAKAFAQGRQAQHRASRASISDGIQKNADGSVDVYFGPKAPEGKDANWVPTDPNRKFELLFRLYGPQKPLFDHTWKLPDVERLAGAAMTPK